MRDWDHADKKVIDFCGKIVRPILRIIVNPEVAGKELAVALTAQIKEVTEATIRSIAGDVWEYCDYGLQLSCSKEEILPAGEQYQQEGEASFVVAKNADFPWTPEHDHHPDDGHVGVWLVSGIRHSCLVLGVSSARQARDKALGIGGVGEWELYDIKFVGEDLPEVIPI